MTYAAGTRADTKKTKSMIRTTEMQTLRAITGHTLRGRIPSAMIRKTCDVKDIVCWVRQRKREWNNYIYPERERECSLHERGKNGENCERWETKLWKTLGKTSKTMDGQLDIRVTGSELVGRTNSKPTSSRRRKRRLRANAHYRRALHHFT